MWQPREDYWNYIKNLLESSVGINTSTTLKTDHSSLSKSIEEFAKLPDSAFYFAFIFVYDNHSISDPARGLAGLLLKNKLRASLDCLNEDQVSELLGIIKVPLLKLLDSSNNNCNTFIQRTVGTILSILVTDCGVLHQDSSWPDLLQNLLEIGSLAAFSAIEKICEDAAFELIDHQDRFNSFLESIFNSLGSVNINSEIKNSLLLTLGHLIPTQPTLLTTNLDFLIQCTISNFDNPINSCVLLSTLLEFCWTFMTAEHLNSIFSFVLNLSTQTEDRQLLGQCGEFWLIQVQGDFASEQLKQCPQILDKLVPLLIDRCSYDDEEDEDELCQALEDLSVPDDEDDLKPLHRKTKKDLKSSVEDSDESDDPEDSLVSSIRKCSAATLDGLSLATPSPRSFLQIFIAAFNNRVGSADWKVREGALLALGAVIEGVWKEFTAENVQQISDFLLANAQTHPHPLVRSMAIWTLSRLIPYTQGLNCLTTLIGSLGDANKRVQQSASTALCKYLEFTQTAPEIEHFESLASAIFLALKCYQRRSLLVLYDLIRVFGACQGFDLEIGACYWKSIAVILVDKIGPESLADSSIFPIIEALISLLLSDFQGNLLELSKRDEMNFKALSLAAQNLTALKEESFDPRDIVLEGLDDFLIASLDLLAAATETCRLFPSQSLHEILKTILIESLGFNYSSNVRQSAFALFGDYSSLNPPNFFDNSLSSAFLTAVKSNLIPSSLQSPSQSVDILTSMATATNAIWSLGEFSLHYQIPQDFPRCLLEILKDRPILEAGARIYFENVAVSLGRILIKSSIPENVSISDPASFLNRVTNLLGTVESESEKSSAFAGYLKLFSKDPASFTFIESKVKDLVDFSSADSIHPALHQNLQLFRSF